MKNSIENVPNEIFDWMTSHSFETLSADRKRIVLQYFSEDEYNELFESNMIIQKTLHAQANFHSGKDDLMNLFDKKYTSKEYPLKWKNSILWKAASVLLFISTCWFAFNKSGNPIVTNPVTVIKNDTVFIERNAVAVTQKPDTVYIDRTVEKQVTQTAISKKPEHKVRNLEVPRQVSEKEYGGRTSGNTDFQILSVNSINNVSNTSKRNSMNDDSLEKNFKFVSM